TPCCFCDDETHESLGKLLVEHGGRMLVSAPEGTAFEIVNGRYSSSPVFDVYLKGHAGDTYRAGRITRGRDTIDHPALSVALAVQPDVVRGLATHARLRARGFLSRFLYGMPESRLGRRNIAAPGVEPALQEEYERRIRKLWEVGYASADQTGETPHLVHFSP